MSLMVGMVMPLTVEVMPSMDGATDVWNDDAADR